MGKLSSREFWESAGERCIKTFCQTALSMLTVGQAFVDVNWANIVSVSLVAALISVLTSIVTLDSKEVG